MLYSLKVYSKDIWIRYFLLASILLHLSVWVEVIRNVSYINKEITFIIHTSVIAGANLYGQWWSVYYFPGAGLVILLINFLLSVWFFRKEPLLARCLMAATVGVQVTLFILTYLIIRVNT